MANWWDSAPVVGKSGGLDQHLGNPNVQRFLNAIALAEGTAKDGRDPYRVGFGGSEIADLASHPNVRVPFKQTDGKSNVTTAAGKYQFLKGTWDDLAQKHGLTDFSPRNQDLGAIALLQQNGALDDVLKGDFDAAVKKSGKTWASLPSSPYAQPKRSEGFVAKALGAAVPSANAATGGDDWWAAAPVVDPAQPKQAAGTPEPEKPGFLQNLAVGAIRGAGNIGATILTPIDAAARAMGIKNDWIGRDDRRSSMDQFADQNADTSSIAYQGGKLGAEIAGTAPIGGIIGKAVGAVSAPLAAGTKAAPVVNALTNSLATGGFRVGAGVPNKLAELAIRGAGGAAVGGASAGLVDPEMAGTGALIGGALPIGAKAAGASGNALRRMIVGEGASPEVAALARRAADLGIDIPADRLVNSKPLNAVSSGLNYVPLSGRAATEAKMESQMNRALSRTFGQDSDNVTMALRKASDELGSKFDDVLKNNTVAVDDGLLTKLGDIAEAAKRELGSDGARIIESQIDELLNKGVTGKIDGQAAYNIKRTLDRIGRRNTPEAFQAREIKGALMEALDRSLGPEAAAAFAKTRQQYGNMLSLENLAQNGAEGGVSIARLANMKNINNPALQELADIAAQFVKAREGQHGAMQRGAAALGLGGTVGLPGLAGTMAAGRATNMLLNSNPMRNMMLQQQGNRLLETAAPNLLTESLRRTAPLLPNQGIPVGQR